MGYTGNVTVTHGLLFTVKEFMKLTEKFVEQQVIEFRESNGDDYDVDEGTFNEIECEVRDKVLEAWNSFSKYLQIIVIPHDEVEEHEKDDRRAFLVGVNCTEREKSTIGYTQQMQRVEIDHLIIGQSPLVTVKGVVAQLAEFEFNGKTRYKSFFEKFSAVLKETGAVPIGSPDTYLYQTDCLCCT